MPSCKGVCHRKINKAPKPKRLGSRYAHAKRCTVCDIWIKIEFQKCPCCNMTLKSRPSYTYQKEKLMEELKH